MGEGGTDDLGIGTRGAARDQVRPVIDQDRDNRGDVGGTRREIARAGEHDQGRGRAHGRTRLSQAARSWARATEDETPAGSLTLTASGGGAEDSGPVR